MIVLRLTAISIDPACIVYSNLFREYVSIVGYDGHWSPIDWNVHGVSLALAPSSIIFSLNDVIHVYLDVGDGSIEGHLERSYCFLIDGNVGLVGIF